MTNFRDALAWALLHFLWQGAAIALLLAFALWIFRAARVRYVLACGAMVAMIAAFAATLAICWPAPVPHRPSIAGAHTARAVPLPDIPDSAVDVPRQTAPPRWFVPVWTGGVTLFYLYSLFAWLAATRLKARGTVVAPLGWQHRLATLAADLGLRRAVTLLESCLTEVPVVIGYFRPVILLPVGLLAGLAPDEVEAILIHELAHICRYDYLVNVAQTLVEGLLFYHPAVWWVGRVMRCEREHCCDDTVVALQGDACAYAVTLARLELNRGSVGEPALAATGGNLMSRIHRLTKQPEGPRIAAPLLSATVLIAAATLALAAWQPPPQPQPAPDPGPAPAPAATPAAQETPQPRPLTSRQERAREKVLRKELETPYRKWLNEDVAYIITDQERAAFQLLTTNAEYEQFIEQFWLRRDPTPGTVENEYKEEHYRRIAYSNEHFASNAPGWKTDRGRIYITYGPPDEIEDHSSGGAYKTPAGTNNTVPFQQWRYRWIEGVGNNVIIEFVDPTRDGEFRMTLDPSEKFSDALAAQRNLPVTVKVDPIPQTYVGNVAQTVEIQARLMTVSVPLISRGRNQVTCRVSLPNGRVVSNFEQEVDAAAGQYSRKVPLVPGSYRVSVVVRDVATGTSQQGETTVQVQ